MFGEEPVANASNPLPGPGIRAGVDGDVAFGVDPHRTAREVRRSDSRQDVVDDHHLRVHEGRDIAGARRRRIHETQSPVPVVGDQLPKHPVAQHAHGLALEPSLALLGHDCDDLRSVALAQPLTERCTERVVGEVLALDVDGVPCRRNRIQEQRLAFPGARPPLRGGESPRDRDVGVDEIGVDIGRPEIRGGIGQRRSRLLTHCAPTVAHEGPESGRRRATQHRLHLVIRPVRLAQRRRPGRLVGPVCGGVPPMPGQVDAAAERQGVVDDDDLLVMGAADRMVVVEAESHLSGHPPAEPPSRQRIAFERVERRVIPDEDVAAQLRALSHDEGEQFVEAGWRGVWWLRLIGQEIEVGLDVPPDDEDRMARLQQRLPRPPEVVGRVLHAAEAIGALHAPAVVAGARDRRLESAAALGARGARHRGAHRTSGAGVD